MKLPMIYDAISPGAIIIPGIITLAVIALVLFLLVAGLLFVARSVREKNKWNRVEKQNRKDLNEQEK